MTPEAFSRMVTLFMDDSARQLDALADDLVLLGEDPEDRHVLERAHRTVHTVKGSAAMLALRTGDENLAMRLEAVSNLARAAEERFAAALDGTYPLTEAALDVLGEVPVLLKPVLQETDAGRAAAWREGFEALQRRISERNVPREIPREAALELPTEEELRAIFEADASLRAKPFPTGEDEQLTRWLGERVPLEQEGVAAPPDEEMLDQLEDEITSFSPGLGETPEAHVPHAGEVSLEAYRGETLPPLARSSEPSGSPELERELEEAAGLLDEDIAPSALSSLERGRRNAPSPPKKGEASEETSPTEEEGKAVLDALAEILGVAQEREQPPDKARENRAEETSGEVAPRAEGDERDLADLLELEREEREPAERGSVPEPRVGPTPPAEPQEEPTTTLAAPSAEGLPVPAIEAEQELREEEQSLADLLGLDVDEEHQGPTGTDGSVAREPSDEEARAPSADPERAVAAEVRRAAPSASTEPTPEEEDPMRVIFLEEARHLLDELNQELVAFERSPGDSETLRRILRAAHTLKGSAATVGYERISTVAHRMEDLLQIARDRGIELNADAIDVLLSATDRIDELTKEIAQHGQERGEIDEIVARLESVGHRAVAPTRQESAREAGLESVSGVPKEVGTAEAETLREVFVQEARELLDVLGRDLVTLEQQPEDAEVVHRAMRTAHTLKGSAAMLEYEGIRTLAHAMEDALQVIRDAQLRVSSDAVDLMLSAVDTLDAQVKAIALTGQESHEGDTEGLGRRLRRLASELSGSTKPEQGRAPVVVEEVAPPERELGETFLEEAHTRHTSLTQALVVLEHNSGDEEARAQFADAALALTGSAAALGFQQVAAVAGHMEAIVQTAKEQNVPLDPEALDALGEGMELLGALLVTLRNERHDRAPDITPVLARLKEVRVGGESVTVEMAPTVPSQTRHAPAVEPEPVENRRTARRIVEVDLDRLNRLMNLAAELLISRTRLSAELLHLSSVVDILSEQGHNLTDVERRLAEMRGNLLIRQFRKTGQF